MHQADLSMCCVSCTELAEVLSLCEMVTASALVRAET